MTRKIVITSGKGGVGKTTITASLGVALARMGYKTLLIDMDFGLNNLDILFGIENKIVYDIIDVLESKCQPRQAIIQDLYENNLFIFPSTHSFCRVRFGARELMAIINCVEKDFDFVLIDSPAGIDGGFRRAIESASETIVVTTPHLSAIRDADKTIGLINNFKIPYLIVNRARGDLIIDEKMVDIEDIRKNLNAELIGVIPEDDCVVVQTNYAERIDDNADFYVAINLIAKNLISGETNLYDCKKKYKGVVGFLRKKLTKF